jgi:hypothetical protein
MARVDFILTAWIQAALAIMRYGDEGSCDRNEKELVSSALRRLEACEQGVGDTDTLTLAARDVMAALDKHLRAG